jgi:hypothetical protein
VEAVEEVERLKALIHLVPQEQAGDSFAPAVQQCTRELREQPAAAGLRVNSMLQLPDDPFGQSAPYRAALELIGDDTGAIEATAAEAARRLEPIARLDDSTLLLGLDVVFIRSERAPVRYQQLMWRNADFDHSAYLKRYREIHSGFGLRTPGILGYVQFHVDDTATERAARRCGMGIWDADSVSELHLDSLERFLGEVAQSNIGDEAAADEAVFVDRARNQAFCSAVDWHP